MVRCDSVVMLTLRRLLILTHDRHSPNLYPFDLLETCATLNEESYARVSAAAPKQSNYAIYPQSRVDP